MSAAKRKGTTSRVSSVRLSITFAREQYDLLERIARDKKVSVAWVARDAVEQYLAQKWPLLGEER